MPLFTSDGLGLKNLVLFTSLLSYILKSHGGYVCYLCVPVRRELNAFIYDATVLDYMASHDDNCRLKTVGKWFAATGYGIGFPKGSRWITVVNKFMVQFQYDGRNEFSPLAAGQ